MTSEVHLPFTKNTANGGRKIIKRIRSNVAQNLGISAMLMLDESLVNAHRDKSEEIMHLEEKHFISIRSCNVREKRIGKSTESTNSNEITHARWQTLPDTFRFSKGNGHSIRDDVHTEIDWNTIYAHRSIDRKR